MAPDINPYREKYQAAFDSFLEKMKADETILAVYLFGSLARGDVWAKSDLDVFVVTKDERKTWQTYALVEHGITFHCDIFSRNHFRRLHERILRGSTEHHVFTSGRLVYARDESLNDYFENMAFVGQRDREMLALRYGAEAVASQHDGEKALLARQDAAYGFVWLLEMVKILACIETVLNGLVVEREVIHQARRCNPAVFDDLFEALYGGEKDLAGLNGVLARAEGYLVERAERIFAPLLQYLQEAGEVRGADEIARHFAARLQMHEGDFRLVLACEWLAGHGWLQKVSAPLKLTTKSRVLVDGPAYFYTGGGRDA